MKNRLLLCLWVVSSFLFEGYAAEQIKTSVRYHQGGLVVSRTYFETDKQVKVTDTNGCEWLLTVDKRSVENDKTAQDYTFTWELKRGVAKDVSFSVEFEFEEWTPDNYVFVPAIVYDGNRFDVKDIGYPPFWYDKKEWRLNMPTTTTVQPTLGKKDTQSSRIELTSGNASTPLMAFFSTRDQKAWMVQTNQGNSLGDYGLTIEEKKNRSEAVFSIQAPATRTGNKTDAPATVSEGEKVTIHCRLYDFKAKRLNDMMDRFLDVRKTFNASSPHEVVPYSEVWKLMNNLYQSRRWDDRIDMYWLSDVQETASWNFIWQLGWCGGGQSTFPILMNGSDQDKSRAMRNLEAIYSRTQAKSGFYYAYGNGREFFGFGYFKPLEHNVTMVRSQGDWLYMAQLQMNLLNSRGEQIKPHWLEGTRKQADAFVRLWDKYGQFGQFVDVETGDICIGSSTAGAIVPAGLALASERYGNPRYLEVACEAGRQFYQDYVVKGYTTGGPGEILSTPDSESAFALFESYMALYEATGSKEWLTYASELLPVCASWTVSYDFTFPETSSLGKIDARSCGSVWASVANKHAAPGICTWSGDCLLKYYRATGDERSLDLLTDIAHNLPQYISRQECPIGTMPPGGVCERVNLSDWEGKDQVGGSIFGSCSWCEVATMLTVTQLPSIYVQTDRQLVTVFDHLKVKKKKGRNGHMLLDITNPTSYPADVKIYSETSEEARRKPMTLSSGGMQTVHLKPGESKTISCISVEGKGDHGLPTNTTKISVKPGPGTLQKAIDRAVSTEGNVVIEMDGGEYRTDKTIEILPGKWNSLLIRGKEGKEVSISGDKVVTPSAVKIVKNPTVLSCLQESVCGKVLEVDCGRLGEVLANIRPSGFGRKSLPAWSELIVDDEPLRLSRWPNDSLVLIGRVDVSGGPEDKKQGRLPVFHYKEERPSQWKCTDNMWIGGYFGHGYADDMIPVGSINPKDSSIHAGMFTTYQFFTGADFRRWCALNLLEEIDQVGEYVIDPKAQKFYFLPGDKALSNLRLTVLDAPIIALEGCKNVTIQGVTIENSRDIGVYMDNTENILIQGCTIRNVGNVGVCIGKGTDSVETIGSLFNSMEEGGTLCGRKLGNLMGTIYENTVLDREAGKNNGVKDCYIYNTGAGGVSLGGGNRLTLSRSDNYVENCKISRYNRIEKSYRPGIWMDGVGNRISRCDISDAPSMAILFHGNEHVIEYCDITQVCQEVDDQGAIYYGRDPSERGNVIRYNYFHELSPRHRVTATYHDDGACGSQVYGNIYFNAGSLPVLIGGGMDHTYSNNIFIDSPTAIHLDNRLQNWAVGMLNKEGIFDVRMKAVNYLEPPYSTQYPELTHYWQEDPAFPKRNQIHGNLFYKIRNLLSGSSSWGEFWNNWITNEDPGFVDPSDPLKGFKENAEVFKRIEGFEEIPYSEIGSTLE